MKKSMFLYLAVFCSTFIWYACRDSIPGWYSFPEYPAEELPEAPEPGKDFPTERDPYLWPFSTFSIWNMPIGEEAEYVHARLEPADGITIDEDYIILKPDLPLIKVYENHYGWSQGDRYGRCHWDEESSILFEAPIPESWIVSPDVWDGLTPNAGVAVLLKDGETLIEGQPFAHCEEGPAATCGLISNQGHKITGDGMYGAHGGSGLTAIGGTLRSHELTPTSGPIRHALKINLFGAKNLYWDTTTQGYRWPATKADGYAHERSPESQGYGVQRNTDRYPVIAECRMGALLALPPSIKIDQLGLKTQPAKIIAQALQDYGAYVVDDTAWNVHAFAVEWSPDSRFHDEFLRNWGFSFVAWNGEGSEWKTDIDVIFENLHVVTNNTAESIGGPGFRRQPYAPVFSSK